MVAGIPTAHFRDRLSQMATNASLLVVGVDPAYSSRWGAEPWLVPGRQINPAETTAHHAGSGHRPSTPRAPSTVTGKVCLNSTRGWGRESYRLRCVAPTGSPRSAQTSTPSEPGRR